MNNKNWLNEKRIYGRINSEEFDWCKPPNEASKAEKDWLKDLIIELNEMEMAAANFRRHLHEAYLINPKQVRDETLIRIKAKGWVEAWKRKDKPRKRRQPYTKVRKMVIRLNQKNISVKWVSKRYVLGV